MMKLDLKDEDSARPKGKKARGKPETSWVVGVNSIVQVPVTSPQ
jgi:hypothetical protein